MYLNIAKLPLGIQPTCTLWICLADAIPAILSLTRPYYSLLSVWQIEPAVLRTEPRTLGMYFATELHHHPTYTLNKRSLCGPWWL